MKTGKNNILNAVLLFIVIVILLIPAAQKEFFKWKEKPLNGDVRLAPDTTFSFDNWFQGDYAVTKEKYLNDNFGFRSSFIRLTDQIYYSLFNAMFARDVVAGKDGYLYELKYLQAHAGIDYIGEKEINSKIDKLKFIQDTLAKKGIHFALLFAPGKATYYPEYIPAPYDKSSLNTNYLKFVEAANREGINYIDYNALFLKLKSQTKYPLYPQTGTHWSIYGMYVAFDTLTRYMEREASIKLPHYDYSNVVLSDSLIHPDGDIEGGLNLIFDLPHYKMAYPNIKWLDSSHTQRPNVLTVSDSYWMGMYFLYLPKDALGHHEFWYYNKYLYDTHTSKVGDVATVDLRTAVEKSDFIFIMSTEATLKDIGWGFIDELYSLYKYTPEQYQKDKKQRLRNAEITKIKFMIRDNSTWYNNVIKQATELNISIDSCVQLNAEYVYNEDHKDEISREAEMEEIRHKLLNSEEWYNNVKKQATELKISVDSCVQLNVEYLYNELHKK